MFVTAINNVNRRQQDASTASPCAGYIAVNQSVEVTDLIAGDSINGNSLWYQSAVGEYLWSGGFSLTDELLFSEAMTPRLAAPVMTTIYASALHDLTSWFYFTISDCRGVGIGPSDDSPDGISLIVFREKDDGDGSSPVPKVKNYRGYPIQIEVTITGVITAAANGLYTDEGSPITVGGGTLAEEERPENSYGTRAALVVSDGKSCILTCYHVACHSLVRQGIMNYTNQTIQVNIPATFSGSAIQKSGLVKEGSLSGQYDYALVAVDSTAWIVEQIADIGDYNGFYQFSELSYDNLKNVQVKLYGAHTNKVESGGITAYLTNTITIDYKFTDASGQPQLVSAGLSGLIVSSAFSQDGDSGAPVVDSNNKLLGHIVASGNGQSYIMPFAYLNYYKSITLNQNT